MALINRLELSTTKLYTVDLVPEKSMGYGVRLHINEGLKSQWQVEVSKIRKTV